MRFKKRTVLGLSWVLLLFVSSPAFGQDNVSLEGSGEASASADLGGGSGTASAESTSDDAEPEAEKEAKPKETRGGKERGGGGGGAHIERPLLLTRHTMELGGQIGVTSGVSIPHNNPTAEADGGGTVYFSPTLGYFLIDHLELLTELDIRAGFGVGLEAPDGVSVGFGAGLQYVFDFNVVCLYLGGLMGASFYIPYGAGPNIPYFRIRLPIGIMFPFNRHVALNAGMSVDFDIYLGGERGYTHVAFPIGYFGIRGFFNLFND